MARDILGEYGPDSSQPQRARASSGGVTQAKPLPYCPPQGPKGQMHQGPGLGGTNHGNGQRCVADGGSGSVGLGGDNRGNRGTQK